MSRAFSHHGINIKQANCRTYDNGQRAINTFHTSVKTLAQLSSLMRTLQGHPGRPRGRAGLLTQHRRQQRLAPTAGRAGRLTSAPPPVI
jgi:hypothetical protein